MLEDRLYSEELAMKIHSKIIKDIDVKMDKFQKELENNNQ